MRHLESRQNPRVKHVASLRQSRHRKLHQQVVVDGARELLRALEEGWIPSEAYVCRPLAKGAETSVVQQKLQQMPGEIFSISREIYDRLRFGERCDGLVAIGPLPSGKLEDLNLTPRPVIAVLDGLEKPGNLGAIF